MFNDVLFQRCLSEFATDGMVSAKSIKVILFHVLPILVFLSYVAVYMLHEVFTGKALDHMQFLCNEYCMQS